MHISIYEEKKKKRINVADKGIRNNDDKEDRRQENEERWKAKGKERY